MNVSRTLDVGICWNILTNKEIFDSVSEDLSTFEDIHIDVLKDYWLKVEVNSDIIGVVQLSRVFNSCFDCHIHILTEHRKQHSSKAGELILSWCKENIHGSLLYANVPKLYPNVENFLMKFGFTKQGVLPRAWFKNGKMNDMTILTREV